MKFSTQSVTKLDSSPASQVAFVVGGVEIIQMQMKDNQTLSVSTVFKDSMGNPAPLVAGTNVAWAVSNSSLATIVPTPDGLGALVTPKGPLGSFSVQVATAPIGIQPAIQNTLPVEIIPSVAVAVELSGVVS